MSSLDPVAVARRCQELEPGLEGCRVTAAPGEDVWELRIECPPHSHRLRVDALYIEECLRGGDCRHLQELLAEVCRYLEGR